MSLLILSNPETGDFAIDLKYVESIRKTPESPTQMQDTIEITTVNGNTHLINCETEKTREVHYRYILNSWEEYKRLKDS